MHISVSIPGVNEIPTTHNSVLPKIKSAICGASLKSCFMLLTAFLALILVIFICKTYLTTILIWVEEQDTVIINIVILLLFIIVSFPICVGYIIIVIATGYLFNFTLGLITSIICANCGIFVAHNVMKIVGHHSSLHAFITSKTTLALTKLISGSNSFKIVICARLTPIPFGLQNTIFALGNASGTIYHVASLLGLLPGQIVGVYIGSSVRSMQDVLDDKQVGSLTYAVAAIQLILGGALLIWLGTKARTELSRAIADADNSLNKPDKAGFSIV